MSQPEVVFRNASPDDLPAVLELYHHLHTKDDPLDEATAARVWQQILNDAHQSLIVAEADGRAVASCVLAIVPNLTRGGRPYGLIENVVTHVDYRRRGFGRALLQHALQLAWREGCYKVMLLTGRRDEGTLRFYAASGFLAGVKTAFIAYPPAHEP